MEPRVHREKEYATAVEGAPSHEVVPAAAGLDAVGASA